MKLSKSQEKLLTRLEIGIWIKARSLTEPKVNMNTVYALQARGYMEIKFDKAEGRLIKRIK